MGENGVAHNPLPGVEDTAWLRVIELGSLCCLPMAIKAAINLNVMEILGKHDDGGSQEQQQQLSAAQILSRMHVFPASNPRASISLDRILRVLACHGVLTSSLDTSGTHDGRAVRKYGLNSVSKYLVKDDHGASLAPMVLMNQDKVFMETWHYLDEAVLDGGEPFTKAHGKDAFLYGQQDLRFDKLFNLAMANHTHLLIHLLLETYTGFNGVNSLVDVGGGFGACLSMIISKYPHIKGINFDQPHVIAAAPECPGVEHVGGDMFVAVPQADAIFMKWILHDWSDEHCVEILKNCYRALPSKGKVVVVDAVIPSAVESGLRSRVGYHLDLLMFAYNPGGRERTQEELRHLSKTAGFAHMQVICKLNECSVVELYKA